MSYEIMYNWQFLRSAEGLTPVVLMGSSNVTEESWSRANRRTERRARDWFCLFNMLGVTDDEFLAQIKSMTGGEYQEHWKQNGKWVNDATLVRWGQQNVKNAARDEDIILKNSRYCINPRCYEYVCKAFRLPITPEQVREAQYKSRAAYLSEWPTF